MSNNFEMLTSLHPCFSLGHKNGKGRIHLPVSPGCNIFCRFCKREINDTSERPGVSSTILSPHEAVAIVQRAVALCPEITVVGIAGPGDTLATSYALDTFRLLKAELPHLLKCMSTNGLLLSDRADELIEVGIDSLTVTVNAVDPLILQYICGDVIYKGKRYQGEQAAELLIHKQLEGIQKISKAGITVKVNTVLIPEINADHIKTVAKTVSAVGAHLYNIIPLIPQHELAWCTTPDCDLLSRVRAEAEEYLPVFRHCQRCRADAAGIPGGKDISAQLYIKPILQTNTFSHG